MTEKEAFRRALRIFDSLVVSDLINLLARYPGPFINETCLPPQVKDVARTEASAVFTEGQLVLLLTRHWEWLQHHWPELSEATLREGAYHATQEYMCPFCGAEVSVDTQPCKISCDQCDYLFDREMWDV